MLGAFFLEKRLKPGYVPPRPKSAWAARERDVGSQRVGGVPLMPGGALRLTLPDVTRQKPRILGVGSCRVCCACWETGGL